MYIANRVKYDSVDMFNIYKIEIEDDIIMVNSIPIKKNEPSKDSSYIYDPKIGLILDNILTPISDLTNNKLAHQLIYDEVIKYKSDKVLVSQYVSDKILIYKDQKLVLSDYSNTNIHCVEKTTIGDQFALVASGYYKNICKMLDIATDPNVNVKLYIDNK